MANGADSTQYAIDMAARLTGEESIDQLVEIADRLVGAGKAASSFDAAIAQTSAALAQATANTETASNALAEAEASYAELEKAAVRAWTAAEKASLKGAVPDELVQKLNAMPAVLRKEAAALDELRAKAAAAEREEDRLAGTLKKLEAGARSQVALTRSTTNLGESFEKVGGVLGRLGGPLGQLGAQAAGGAGSIAKMASAMGVAAASGLALLAVVALVTAGLAVAIVRTAQWGVGLADAARSAILQTEAIEEMNPALVNLGDGIREVQRATELGREDIEQLAVKLADAKVSAEDMPAALRAMAQAETALGKGGADKFIEQLKTGKKSVGELSAEIERRLGPIVDAKLRSLDFQSARLKRNLGETFGGLNIEPLLEGMTTLVALFDQNTAVGKTLKNIFEALFQPLIDGATEAIPVIEAFVIGFLIGALKIYLAFKPAIQAVREFLGSTDTALPDALDVALTLGKALAATLAGVVTVLGAIAALVAAPIIAVVAAVSFLRSVDLSEVGRNIIGGLAKGINEGTATVIAAMTGVVEGAIKSAKQLLGIASDSKVFKAIGGFTAGGMESGVEEGTPAVQSAMESMVEPRTVAQPAAAGSQAGAGHRIRITINTQSDKPEEIERVVRQVMLDVLEGNVLEIGAGQFETEPESA